MNPMELSAQREALVAIDLGAQSCRVSLLRWKHGEPRIELIHRFPNAPVAAHDTFRWDIGKILDGLNAGLRLCAEATPQGIAAIGVDGWAVDYVRLAPGGSTLADPFCYRDERTQRSEVHVHEIFSPDRLYSL